MSKRNVLLWWNQKECDALIPDACAMASRRRARLTSDLIPGRTATQTLCLQVCAPGLWVWRRVLGVWWTFGGPGPGVSSANLLYLRRKSDVYWCTFNSWWYKQSKFTIKQLVWFSRSTSEEPLFHCTIVVLIKNKWEKWAELNKTH